MEKLNLPALHDKIAEKYMKGEKQKMKKSVCVLAACIFMSGLTACSHEEVQNAATATIEQNGVTMSMVFDAKGDTVTKITQESVIDLTGYTEEEIDAVNSTVEAAKEVYADLDGIEYSTEQKDGKIIEKIVMPTDEETLEMMIDQGLLPVSDENITQLSLDATLENLENSGWTIE